MLTFLFSIQYVMCKLSNEDLEKIMYGDMDSLGILFKENYNGLLNSLRVRFASYDGREKEEDMKDALQDAFFLILQKIRDKEFKNENPCGFIVGVAYNKLRDRARKNRRNTQFEVDAIETYLLQSRGAYHVNLTPRFSDLDDEQRKKVDVMMKVFEDLGESCRKLLTSVWINENRLIDIWEELNYKNYKTARSSKSRCVSTLKNNINAIMGKT